MKPILSACGASILLASLVSSGLAQTETYEWTNFSGKPGSAGSTDGAGNDASSTAPPASPSIATATPMSPTHPTTSFARSHPAAWLSRWLARRDLPAMSMGCGTRLVFTNPRTSRWMTKEICSSRKQSTIASARSHRTAWSPLIRAKEFSAQAARRSQRRHLFPACGNRYRRRGESLHRRVQQRHHPENQRRGNSLHRRRHRRRLCQAARRDRPRRHFLESVRCGRGPRWHPLRRRQWQPGDPQDHHRPRRDHAPGNRGRIFPLTLGIDMDSQGNLYFTTGSTGSYGIANLVMKITSAGVISTVAGSETALGSHVDASGAAARFYGPAAWRSVRTETCWSRMSGTMSCARSRRTASSPPPSARRPPRPW